ncbi:HAD family hydrolase [Carboxylicivirga sp. M1479]|uniref:HAD family hydrolase n=1 Tax=Carboxylicivirga sp. M1479 TaxID=2594476 RepID=UPI0011776172|nr:HAD family hydrolase [Carboxylicivirga sp. M1479]TRX66054.1 HAD family hydrolase [Carboxylicivirga sp. M1479]
MKQNIKVIAFDADDTLWVNETFFRDAEKVFATIMKPFAKADEVYRKLYEVEMNNMLLYGYGIKGFMLSLIETANVISNNHVSAQQIGEIIEVGKSMLQKPVELLDGVEQVLKSLQGDYRLIVATKGDLLDQERKLRKSGLLPYFHHIEVMSDKTPSTYQALIKHLDIENHELLMVGNSLKSDILPVLQIGSWGVHVPFHTTWHHEEVNEPIISDQFYTLGSIIELEELMQD